MAVPCILWPRIRPSYLKHKHLLIGLMVLFLVGEIVCPPPRRSDQNVPTNAKDHNEVTNDETNASVTIFISCLLFNKCFFFIGCGC